MKILFIGGIKSGKSYLAEKYILEISKNPIYLATSEILDSEMNLRISTHKEQRDKSFKTIEEPRHLVKVLKSLNSPVLVECITMWLNNMIYYGERDEDILNELIEIMQIENDIVFVLNDVGSGIIPNNAIARRFVDLSGKASQIISSKSDEVYHCIAAIRQRIK